MNTILVIKNSFIVLSSENEELLENVYDTLSFKDSSKAFAWGRFDPNRVKTIRFAKFIQSLDLPSLQIPIGFLAFTRSVLSDIEHSEIDGRKELEKIEWSSDKFEGLVLHDHQIKAISKSLENRRGIIMSPTGSGKCVSGDTEITIEFDSEDEDLIGFIKER